MAQQLAAMRGLPIRPTLGHAAAAVVHAALMAGAVVTWGAGWWWATAAVWCAIAWMDHAALTRLHEAAHGMLSRRRWLNEVQGVVIGTAAFTPLSVYRYVHARHHAHLGRERDPEFWPYNLPGTARWVRLVYAWSELAVGWVLTPALYSVRTAASWRSVPRMQRGRLVAEWAVLIGTWGGVVAVVEVMGWWEGLLVAHVVPAWLAGTMQTVRKFTEHLGMFGEGIMGMTRTVVYGGVAGRAASASQLHVEHHATHHRFARIPYYALPEATGVMYAGASGGRVFRTHVGAMLDMAPHLLDPKVGPQWGGADGAKEQGGDGPERDWRLNSGHADCQSLGSWCGLGRGDGGWGGVAGGRASRVRGGGGDGCGGGGGGSEGPGAVGDDGVGDGGGCG